MKLTSKLLIFSLFSILSFSCYNKFTIGLDLLPKEDLTSMQIIDTITIVGRTVESEPVRTDQPSALLIGRYEDPYFGTTSAGFVVQMLLIDYPGFPDDIVLDSICFKLPLYYSKDDKDAYYGDPFSPVRVHVYRISNELNSSDKHYSNEVVDTSGYTLIGDEVIRFSPSDSMLTIKLSNDFGQYLIDNEDDIFYSYGTYFHQIIKGFYFEPYQGNGAIYKVDINKDRWHTKFKMVMYYHTESKPDSERIFNGVQGNNLSLRYNVYKHDYTNAAFYQQLQNPDDYNNTMIFLQGMGGTKAKIKFPYIKNLRKKNFVINKAELIFKIPEQTIGKYPPISEIALMGKDTAGNEVFFQDFIEPVSNSYIGAKLENYNEYRLNVTRFIQAVINGNYDNIDFYIVNKTSSTDFKRTVLSTSLNTSEPMKLVIFYTKLPTSK